MIDRRGQPIPSATLWRRRARRVVLLFVLGMAVLATAVGTTGPYFSANTGASSVPVGLFVSSQASGDVLALGKTLGVTPTIDTVYADGSCYCTYSPPSTSMTLMLGVGALTPSEATGIGQSLVPPGRATPSSASCGSRTRTSVGGSKTGINSPCRAAQYISTFQSIVTTMRSYPARHSDSCGTRTAGPATKPQGGRGRHLARKSYREPLASTNTTIRGIRPTSRRSSPLPSPRDSRLRFRVGTERVG